jgi:hypothetical protein
MWLEDYVEMPFVVMLSLTPYEGDNTDDDTP